MLWTYTIRGLLARRRTIAPTIFAMASTVAAVCLMFALYQGVKRSLERTAHLDYAIVKSQGANAESTSQLSIQSVDLLKALGGIKRDGNAEQISLEFVIPLSYRSPTGEVKIVNVRGVDPIAFDYHGVKLKSGAMPQHSTPGVLIGPNQVGKLPGFQEGGELLVGKSKWPVIGTISAPNTVFEAEFWCDRTALMNEFRRTRVSVAYVRLSSPDQQAAFAKDVSNLQQSDTVLEALSETEFYAQNYSDMDVYLTAILAVGLLLALGAIFASANTMYALFLGRIRELATLNAIGFTKARVSMLLLQEAFILAALSGLLGIFITQFADGRTLEFRRTGLVYQIFITPEILLTGLGVAGVVGLIGGLVSVIQAARMETLPALRSAV